MSSSVAFWIIARVCSTSPFVLLSLLLLSLLLWYLPTFCTWLVEHARGKWSRSSSSALALLPEDTRSDSKSGLYANVTSEASEPGIHMEESPYLLQSPPPSYDEYHIGERIFSDSMLLKDASGYHISCPEGQGKPNYISNNDVFLQVSGQHSDQAVITGANKYCSDMEYEDCDEAILAEASQSDHAVVYKELSLSSLDTLETLFENSYSPLPMLTSDTALYDLSAESDRSITSLRTYDASDQVTRPPTTHRRHVATSIHRRGMRNKENLPPSSPISEDTQILNESTPSRRERPSRRHAIIISPRSFRA